MKKIANHQSATFVTLPVLDKNKVRKLARDLDMSEVMLLKGLEKARTKHSLSTNKSVITRLNEVRTALQRELGGRETVQAWLHRRNRALDNRRPVDLISSGRLDVLERVRQALENSRF